MVKIISDGYIWIFTNDRKKDFEKFKYALGNIYTIDENFNNRNIRLRW